MNVANHHPDLSSALRTGVVYLSFQRIKSNADGLMDCFFLRWIKHRVRCDEVYTGSSPRSIDTIGAPVSAAAARTRRVGMGTQAGTWCPGPTVRQAKQLARCMLCGPTCQRGGGSGTRGVLCPCTANATRLTAQQSTEQGLVMVNTSCREERGREET